MDTHQKHISKQVETILHEELKNVSDERITNITKKIISEVYNSNGNLKPSFSSQSNDNVKREKKKGAAITEKIFIPRNSPLTDLFEIPHIKSVYHFIIVIFLTLLLSAALHDLVSAGRMDFGLKIIIAGFGKIHIVAMIWISMQLYALLPYLSIVLWARCRSAVPIPLKKALDFNCILLAIFYQCVLSIYPCYLTRLYDLPFVSAVIVLAEMIRFMMKSHAFIRSNAPKVLNVKVITNLQLPTFSWYIYFLFAPTLIYRDHYPRTSKIRWKFVIKHLFEILLAIFCLSYLCEHIVVRPWRKFGLPSEKIEAQYFVLTLFSSMLPSLMGYLCGFYILLHCWLNATAEMLRFADRHFYTDWWNQINFSGYYRTWNIVVHDWLHTYVYKDIILLTKNRLLSTISVFVISAIYHEVILTVGFGFFYPVLFIIFGTIGIIVVFTTRYFNPTIGNIFLWWSLTTGEGILWTLYGMEYYARHNCPGNNNYSLIDFSFPRSWKCHQISFPDDWSLESPFSHLL